MIFEFFNKVINKGKSDRDIINKIWKEQMNLFAILVDREHLILFSATKCFAKYLQNCNRRSMRVCKQKSCLIKPFHDNEEFFLMNFKTATKSTNSKQHFLALTNVCEFDTKQRYKLFLNRWSWAISWSVFCSWGFSKSQWFGSLKLVSNYCIVLVSLVCKLTYLD